MTCCCLRRLCFDVVAMMVVVVLGRASGCGVCSCTHVPVMHDGRHPALVGPRTCVHHEGVESKGSRGREGLLAAALVAEPARRAPVLPYNLLPPAHLAWNVQLTLHPPGPVPGPTSPTNATNWRCLKKQMLQEGPG